MSAPLPSDASFSSELRALLNRHSRENASNTPDWILAEYLLACLEAFELAIHRRTHGRENGGG